MSKTKEYLACEQVTCDLTFILYMLDIITGSTNKEMFDTLWIDRYVDKMTSRWIYKAEQHRLIYVLFRLGILENRNHYGL